MQRTKTSQLRGCFLVLHAPLRDAHPLVVLAEDAVADAVPRFLGVDDREIEAIEELGRKEN